MYRTSQGYCSVCSGCGRCGSGLELITGSTVGYLSSSSPNFSYSSEGNYFSYAAAAPVSAAAPLSEPSYASLVASLPVYGSTDHFHLVTSPSLNISYNPENKILTNSLTYAGNKEIKHSLFRTKMEYDFQPDNFLKPGKGTKFVGQAEEIKGYIEETFEKMFNEPFPDDIKISLLDETQFRKLTSNSGTIGLSINRRKLGLLSEIFVLNNTLGRVLLTVGHEIGHVLTGTLDNPHDEEAKAYAFSLLWMKAVKEHNIANLQNVVVFDQPADNGLHNLAFDCVHQLIRQDMAAEKIYERFVKKNVSCSQLY